MARQTAAEDDAQLETATEEIGTYRRRDSDQLSYDVRSLLEAHDFVEVWSDDMQLLASADSRSAVWEIEGGNRGVMVDGVHVKPEDVVEIVAHDEVEEEDVDDEIEPAGDDQTAEIEILYTKGAHTRDAPKLEPGTEAFELARDLRCFADETFDRREELTLEHAIDVAYASLGDPVEISLEGFDYDATDLDRVADHVYKRLQGPRADSSLPYDGSGTRSASVGDLIVVDGTVVMVGQGFDFPVLGELERDGDDGDDDGSAGDCEICTDGGRDEDDETGDASDGWSLPGEGDDAGADLEGERVLIEQRGPPETTKRTGKVIEVRDTDESMLEETEYVVDLDGAGHAHVTRDALLPVDEIPLGGGVLMSRGDADVAYNALRLALDLGSSDAITFDDSLDAQEVRDVAKTLGRQLAIARHD